jgi:hypothetical protein
MDADHRFELITRELADLKRQNRRIKSGVCSATLCILLGFSIGFSTPSSSAVIKSKDFQLVDNRGEIRARLYFNNRGPMLGFWDARGEHRITLSLREEQPFFVLADGSTKTRVTAGSTEDQTWLKLYDAKEELLWQAPVAGAKAK